MVPPPIELPASPFTSAQAAAVGVSPDVLRGPRVRRIFRGVFLRSDLPVTLEAVIAAARLVLPRDAALSHVTALQRYGLSIGPSRPLHFSTNTAQQSSHDGIALHRRRGTLHPRALDGVPTLGPDRTFVDSATMLGHLDLVRAGDFLVGKGLTTRTRLHEYVHARHLDGVVRARRIVPFVEDRVGSVRETDLRLLLRFARLPAPAVNVEIRERGRFLARGDLVYERYRVLVEYDGWHHERDALQRQKDHLRRERLEAAGWRVIVVTAADMRHPAGIVRRVHGALRQRGHAGPSPILNLAWHRWFPQDL